MGQAINSHKHFKGQWPCRIITIYPYMHCFPIPGECKYFGDIYEMQKNAAPYQSMHSLVLSIYGSNNLLI